MTENFILATVAIREPLTERTFRGNLSNGREIFIFVPRMSPMPRINAGDSVIAKLSLGDFSRGEFAGEAKQPPSEQLESHSLRSRSKLISRSETALSNAPCLPRK